MSKNFVEQKRLAPGVDLMRYVTADFLPKK